MSDDLAAALRDLDGAPDVAAEAELVVTPAKKSPRRWLRGLVFAAGVLLGWLVIGWWLWPVQWSNSSPWQLAPQYQRAYIRMVAEEFGRTSDVFWAKETLTGWDRRELADLLAAIQNETTDAETRRRLTALGEALEMPGAKESLLTSLLNQKGILLAIVLSLLPALVAIALVFPSLRPKRAASPLQELLAKAEPEEEQAEQSLEVLLTDVEMEGQPDQTGQAEAQAVGERGQTEEEGEEDTKSEETEAEQPGAFLEDLASLFEEEDTANYILEALCRDLPEVAIDELAEKVARVAKRLQKSNMLRAMEDWQADSPE